MAVDEAAGGRDEVYDKPIAYEEGDKIIYRASSLGMCKGALVRARLGVSASGPGEMMLKRFQEGNDWEERVLLAGLEAAGFTRTVDLDYLEPYGRVVEGAGGLQVETELAWSNKVVRCHPDGIATKRNGLEKFVVEVKFLGEQMYRDITRDGKWPASYEWQKAVEMLSTGLPLLYIIGEKVVTEGAKGERVVELGEVWTEEVTLADVPFSLVDVKMRVAEVEGYVARGELPQCPVPFMYPCPYWAEHEEKEGPEEITDEALIAWVDVYERAKKAKDQADKDVEFTKKAIAEQMAELHLDSGRCAGYDIAVVADQERGNVSWASWAKAVKKKYPEVDLSEDEFRGKPTKGYVRITEVSG